MDNEETIRRSVQSLKGKKTARRYPPALRRRIAHFVRGELSLGRSYFRLSRTLDMSEDTLRRFLSESHSTALVPVHVVEDPVVEAQRPQEIVIRGGHGVEVSGLNLDEVTQVLRALSCSG